MLVRLGLSVSQTQKSGLKEMEVRNTRVNRKEYPGLVLDEKNTKI